MDNLRGGNPFGCISGIHYQLCLFHDLGVIVNRVISDYDNAVEIGDPLHWCTRHVELILTTPTDKREERGVVFNICAALLQQLNNCQGRRLTDVITE